MHALSAAERASIEAAAPRVLGPCDWAVAAWHHGSSMKIGGPARDVDIPRDLEGWAGLRNVLAHMYTELDTDRIHAALGETAALRRFHQIAATRLAAVDPSDAG